MEREALELYDFLEKFIEDRIEQLYTMQPATIISFNADENTLECSLDKEGITLKDVPISLFGSPTSYLTMPTMVKDVKGLLIFSKHDLWTWIDEGIDADAKSDFSKNNAFFLIGATNTKNKIIYNENAVELKSDKPFVSDTQGFDISSPHFSFKNESDELIAVLITLADAVKDLADKVSTGVVPSLGSTLSTAPEIVVLVSDITQISTKLGGFEE